MWWTFGSYPQYPHEIFNRPKAAQVFNTRFNFLLVNRFEFTVRYFSVSVYIKTLSPRQPPRSLA